MKPVIVVTCWHYRLALPELVSCQSTLVSVIAAAWSDHIPDTASASVLDTSLRAFLKNANHLSVMLVGVFA